MYRFEDIKGHDEVKAHFQSALQMNKVSHAYMIEGEPGMGKRMFANTVAKVLQCKEHGVDACGVCQSCQLYDSGNHPDVIHVEATKKTGIGVDDIREQMNGDVHIKPYVFDYKIYIIHDADKMSIQAQNAMLKTIEEPPSYVRIILLATHSHPFLPTVLSRCVNLKLKPIGADQIEDFLIREHHLPDYQARLYSIFSRGNIGRALELKNSATFKDMRDDMIGFMNSLTKHDKVKVMEQVEVFEKHKDHKEAFLDLCFTWLRDLMVLKSLGEDGDVIHIDEKKQLLKQVPYISYNRISMLIDGIEQINRYERLHINYTLLIEVMLIRAMNTN